MLLVRGLYEVVERAITATGQCLLAPQIKVATYWTSLSHPVDDILPWYPEHGAMEQYHSEFTTLCRTRHKRRAWILSACRRGSLPPTGWSCPRHGCAAPDNSWGFVPEHLYASFG